MPLIYSEKLKTKQPIQITLFHDKTEGIDYFLEATSQTDADDTGVTHHTLLFYGSVFVKSRKTKDHPSLQEFVQIPMLKAEITVNTSDDTYIVKEDWTKESSHRIKNKKGGFIDTVDCLAYESTYNAKNIFTHQDMFGNVIELNAKAIYKNPTISLLLRLVEYGSSSYAPVFLEWYEEQFINPKDPYRALFGASYSKEYQALKQKEG